jgi:hypothetical protein
MTEEQTSALMENLDIESIKSELDMYDIWTEVIDEWEAMSLKNKNSWLIKIWNALKVDSISDAIISSKLKSSLKNSAYVVLDLLLDFLAEDYDKTFLQTKTYDKKRKIKLIRDYRKNIEPPVRKLTNWIWFLKFFGVLAILYGILFFIPLNNVVIHDTSFYSFLFGIVCLGYIIIFTLYLKGKLNSIFLIKLLFMPTSVFIENLEYEKNSIEKFYYWMDNWDDLKKFFELIPGARKTFEVLIDLKYIKIEDKSIIYNKPCTQQVFAEILRDPVFVFSSSISVTNDIFKNVFKKSINQMQQRSKDVSNTDEYKAVRKILIKSGVPTNKEFLNEELLDNKHS